VTTYIIHFIKHTASLDIERELMVTWGSVEPFDATAFLCEKTDLMEEVVRPYTEDGYTFEGIYEIEKVFDPANGASLPEVDEWVKAQV